MPSRSRSGAAARLLRALVVVGVVLSLVSGGGAQLQDRGVPRSLDPDTPTPTHATAVGTTNEPTANANNPHDDADADLPRSAFQPTTDTPTTNAAVPTPTNPMLTDWLSPVAPPASSSKVSATLTDDDVARLRDELAQLEHEQTGLTTQLRAAAVELELLDQQIANEQRFFAETRANTVVRNALPSPRGAATRTLECQGWKKTARCSARGARRPAQDRSCLSEIRGGAAGYCEVLDAASGEHFKVMRADCGTVSTSVTFWCELAPQFANVPGEIERAVVAQARQEQHVAAATPTTATSGIVVVVLASQLRQLTQLVGALRSLGCALPIEVWYAAGNMAAHGGEAWPPPDPAVTLRALTTLPFMTSSVKYAKIHAVLHSAFTNVLCLDVGVLPLRDPTYLFALPQFRDAGTLFWRDTVHPASPESRIKAKSLLWELLDMPFVDMFEQDDRQWMINRDAPNVRTALRVLALFAEQRPNLLLKLELVERTKDFARLAWLKTRTPFHLVAAPPTLGGKLLPDGRFCGSFVVQHDPNGEKLFLHRQPPRLQDDDEYLLRTASVEPLDVSALTHVQVFDRRGLSEQETMLKYDVRSFDADRQTYFAHTQTDRVTTTTWEALPEALAGEVEKSTSR